MKSINSDQTPQLAVPVLILYSLRRPLCPSTFDYYGWCFLHTLSHINFIFKQGLDFASL